jgi:hypothetical protein
VVWQGVFLSTTSLQCEARRWVQHAPRVLLPGKLRCLMHHKSTCFPSSTHSDPQNPRPHPTNPRPPIPPRYLQFVHHCRPFYITGFNADNAPQAAVPAIARKLGPGGEAAAKQRLRAMFDCAAAAGLNVVRTWAHTSDPMYPLQASLCA